VAALVVRVGRVWGGHGVPPLQFSVAHHEARLAGSFEIAERFAIRRRCRNAQKAQNDPSKIILSLLCLFVA